MPCKLLNCDQAIPEREKHCVVKESGENLLPACNAPNVPGDMTERGCTFAGCRGVVGGPVKDVIHLVHGPIGCAFYTWDTRPHIADSDLHMKYCFSTDMKESDIVFGGEKRLHKAILEANQAFPQAKAVFVYSTCAIGLIGDDLKAIAKKAEKEIGKRVIPFYCEGFRGVSQSAGHHIGNITLFNEVVGTKETGEIGPYDVNLIGEYNIRGDIWNLEYLFDERGLGLNLKGRFTGNASFDELPTLHEVRLNILHCHRSSAYICELMKEKYGVPYIDVSLHAIEQTNKALQEVAAFFGLEEQAEKVIVKEVAAIKPEIDFYRSKLAGKRVAIYQGGPRTWHWIKLVEELGMELVVASTTFGHEDDYQKIMDRIKDGVLVIDSPNAVEIEEFLKEYQVDLFISGLKEKYISLKAGVPFINGHTYEDGAYAGYKGFVTFARDMYETVCSPVWKYVRLMQREEYP